MEKSLKSIAVNYGLYLGIVLVLWTVIAYAVNLNLLVNLWIILLILPIIMIIFGIISITKCKGVLKGFINFKQAFSSYFITVAIGTIISTLFTLLLFKFIDTDAALTIKEISIEKSISVMEGFNTPPDVIAESVEVMENQDSFSFKAQIWQIAQSLIFFAIIGLIVAAFMKKNNPDAE